MSTRRYTTVWRAVETGKLWTGTSVASSPEAAAEKVLGMDGGVWELLGVCLEAAGTASVGYEVLAVERTGVRCSTKGIKAAQSEMVNLPF